MSSPAASAAAAIPHKNYVQRLYKRALRTAFDHYAWHRPVYRQHCLAIRQRFDDNRNEMNPVRVQAVCRELRPWCFPTS